MASNLGSSFSGERRSKPRIYIPFPATVQGVDDSGKPFEVDTVIDNLSSNSLYLRLTSSVEQGARLSIIIGLSTSTADKASVPRMMLNGEVLRAEQKPGGACGVAVSFKHPQLL